MWSLCQRGVLFLITLGGIKCVWFNLFFLEGQGFALGEGFVLGFVLKLSESRSGVNIELNTAKYFGLPRK